MIPVKRFPLPWYLRYLPITYKILCGKTPADYSHVRFFEWRSFCAVVTFGLRHGPYGALDRRWYTINLYRR